MSERQEQDMHTDASRAFTTLVTGASAGIGFQVAQRLATTAPGPLVITGRNQARLDEAVASLQGRSGGPVRGVVCDQRHRTSIDQLLEALHGLPPVLQLVANVGVNPVHQQGPGRTHSTDYALFADTLTTNVTHTFYLLSRLLPAMRQARAGRIVLVGSRAYRYGLPGQVSYNVSKSALVGLKNTIVSEYGAAGIGCHLVNPGIVLNERTERLRRRLPAAEQPRPLTEAQVAEAIVSLLADANAEPRGRELDL